MIATARKPAEAKELQALAGADENIVIEQLDVTDHARVDDLAAKYKDQPIDVLLSNAALTPTNKRNFKESYFGCSRATPIKLGSLIIHVGNPGSKVRELSYSWQNDGFSSTDLTVLADHLFEGLIELTLPTAVERFGPTVALLHADLGSGQPEIDSVTSKTLARFLPGLMQSGGVVLSDQPLPYEAGAALALPDGVAEGRYFFYRAA